MRILIEFDSCWQTSFLGDDVKKPIEKVSAKINKPSNVGYMQKFVATSGTRGEKTAPIGKDTILGVLCRLIGDQRKLYQARKNDDFYFKDLEDKIIFNPIDSQPVNELMYLTNKSDDRCSQSSFLGVLNDNNPWFFSKESYLLWSVLFLTKEQLIKFILSEKINTIITDNSLPKNLIARINKLSNTKKEEGEVLKTRDRLISEKQVLIEKKQKLFFDYQNKINKKPPKTKAQQSKSQLSLRKLDDELKNAQMSLNSFVKDNNSLLFDSKLTKVFDFLSNKYPDNKRIGEEYCKNGVIYPVSLYSAALYLQAEHLLADGYDMPFLKNVKGDIQIPGFSKRGFNGVRDWLNGMSGGRKKMVGTPCVIQKHSGKLEIEIKLTSDDKGKKFPDLSRSQEIKLLIENAGVSSFYLGKKGLAYVTKIRG